VDKNLEKELHYLTMAPNNDDENTLNGHPSKQGDRDDLKEEGSEPESDRKIAGAAEDRPRRKRSGNSNSRNNGKRSQKPKRRRLYNNPHPRDIIPEARVIQGYNECAYISEHEDDERELLPTPVQRIGEVVEYRLRQDIPQPQEGANNNASVSFKAANGGGRRHSARCHCFSCFNCW
jgi:hypothetical protein